LVVALKVFSTFVIDSSKVGLKFLVLLILMICLMIVFCVVESFYVVLVVLIYFCVVWDILEFCVDMLVVV
jgi:hypothetical protein